MDCFVLFSYAPHDMYQLTITRYSPGVLFSSFDGLVGTLSYYSYPSVRVTAKTILVCGYSAHVKGRPSD